MLLGRAGIQWPKVGGHPYQQDVEAGKSFRLRMMRKRGWQSNEDVMNEVIKKIMRAYANRGDFIINLAVTQVYAYKHKVQRGFPPFLTVKQNLNNYQVDWCYPYWWPWGNIFCSGSRINTEGPPHSREESPHTFPQVLPTGTWDYALIAQSDWMSVICCCWGYQISWLLGLQRIESSCWLQ